MRRALIGMVVATTSIVLVALLLPMAALIQRFAVEDALAAASLELQATESVVALLERTDLVPFVNALNDNGDGTRTTVLFPGADSIGPDRRVTPEVRQVSRTHRAISNDTAEGVEILVPVTIPGEQDLSRDPDPLPGDLAPVIRVMVSHERLRQDVIVSWLIIGALGVGLLGLAVFVADRLGRRFVGATTDLARTAGRLAGGDLDAQARLEGPPEIREVGSTLNQLAVRIRELLTAEREAVADASHRLRSPITVLRLASSELRDPREREQVLGYVDELTSTLSEVIDEARNPIQQGLGARCDARSVTAGRTAFWSTVAEDQGRPFEVSLPRDPVPVNVLEQDLGAALDVLLENVFTHTGEGVGCHVQLRSEDGVAELSVADHGDGGLDTTALLSRGSSGGGSTGLGLDIARRTAEASGGRLEISSPPGRGTTVTMVLGTADS